MNLPGRIPLPRIRTLRLDKWERPLRAAISTHTGIVRVEWQDISGDWCWFSSGTGEAKREAVPAIQRIEAMCESLH